MCPGGHNLAACARGTDGTTRTSPAMAKIATAAPAQGWGQDRAQGAQGAEAELGRGAGQEVAGHGVHISPCSSHHDSRAGAQSSACPQLRGPRAGRWRGRGLGASGTGAGTGVQRPEGARELREPRIALALQGQQGHGQVWLHTWALLNPEGFAILPGAGARWVGVSGDSPQPPAPARADSRWGLA